MIGGLAHLVAFILLLGAVLLLTVWWERRYWLRRSPGKACTLAELVSNASLGLSYKLVDAMVVATLVVVAYDAVQALGPGWRWPDTPWAWLASYLLLDLVFYWVHRAEHRVRWFWAGHVTHHSAPRFNYSVALRQNLTISLNGTMFLWWVPAALVGVDQSVALVCIELNLLYQYFLHTEMPSRLERFNTWLNTPAHHRVHHGSHPDQIDRNFGGTLILWDKWFGSFQALDPQRLPRYGITHNPPNSLNPITLVLHDWRDLVREIRTTGQWQRLWRPPGWSPRAKGGQAEPSTTDRPEG